MAPNDLQTPWHAESIETVVAEFHTRPEACLTSDEAARRLNEYGPNELPERASTPFWKLVIAQLNSFVVLLLIFASVVSAALGDWVEAIVIIAIVILNAVLGGEQESRADKALAALDKLAAV